MHLIGPWSDLLGAKPFRMACACPSFVQQSIRNAQAFKQFTVSAQAKCSAPAAPHVAPMPAHPRSHALRSWPLCTRMDGCCWASRSEAWAAAFTTVLVAKWSQMSPLWRLRTERYAVERVALYLPSLQCMPRTLDEQPAAHTRHSHRQPAARPSPTPQLEEEAGISAMSMEACGRLHFVFDDVEVPWEVHGEQPSLQVHLLEGSLCLGGAALSALSNPNVFNLTCAVQCFECMTTLVSQASRRRCGRSGSGLMSCHLSR